MPVRSNPKRQRTAALQNASRISKALEKSVRFWSAAVLCRFGLRALLFFLTIGVISGGDWVERGGYRFQSVAPSQPGKTGFTLLNANQTSINFTNFLSQDRTMTNRNLLGGSGLAAGDVDG